MKNQIMKYTICCISLFVFVFTYGEILERKIVVVVPSYNNPIEITRECLLSVLNQDYSNFEIIFSDDCSPQPNIEKLHRSLINEIDKNNKIRYRRNQQRLGPIGNQWHAFHSINPDNVEDNREIIVITVDGDDVLLHSKVLQKVNAMHQNAWVTYGNFVYYPVCVGDSCSYKVDDSIIASNSWRTVPGFPTTHLRTYRLSILKDIPLEAFLYYDQFYPASGDTTLMYASCEKAGFNTAFNPERVYGYRITDQAENKVMLEKHQSCAHYARKQKPFKSLESLPIQLPINSHKADLIIFSYKRPMQLYALLESLNEYVSGLHNITVLYRVDDEVYEEAYSIVKEDFNDVIFVRQSIESPQSDFRSMLLKYLSQLESDYIMFATDDDLVKDYISITDCIRALQKTHAYGFYLRLGKNLTYCYPMGCKQKQPTFIDIGDDVVAWCIKHYEGRVLFDWAYPNTVDMTLYQKNTVVEALNTFDFNSPTALEGCWAQMASNEPSKIGICFEQSKIVNIPLNKVQTVSPINKSMDGDPEQLLQLFKDGLKIDRKPLHQWQNRSAHAESILSFVKR